MITDAAMGTYCDHCKMAWGKLKDKTWHPKAQQQALVVAVSRNGQTRAYCRPCLDGITQGWGKDSNQSWSLQDQMSMAASLDIAKLRVRLSEVASV